MLHVKTPASTANFGCGFDSIGMALKIYNELWIEEADAPLEIIALNDGSNAVPLNEGNLIYRTIKEFFKQAGKEMPGLKLYQRDAIPMTRGMGSSSACIISGLLAANELSKVKAPIEDILQLAVKIEGHPDNVAPALLGGIVIGAVSDKEFRYVRIEAPKDLRYAVMVPSFTISTEKARKILPKTVPHKDAVFNASRTGLLVASLMTHKYENLHLALDDRLHQPYRKTLIPDMEVIFKKAKEYGAKGVFLSGAGPSIIAITPKGSNFEINMNAFLRPLKGNWTLYNTDTDNIGAAVSEQDAPELV